MQKLLKRLSVLVIGPGLSRDERLLQAALVMAKLAFKVEIPIIFDGVCAAKNVFIIILGWLGIVGKGMDYK